MYIFKGNRYIIFIFLILIIKHNFIYSENFNFKIINEFSDSMYSNLVFEINRNVFFTINENNTRSVIYKKDLETNELDKIDKLENFLYILTYINDFFIYKYRIIESKKRFDSYYYYNPFTHETGLSKEIMWINDYFKDKDPEGIRDIIYYQNNIFYVQTFVWYHWKDKIIPSIVKIFNTKEEAVEDFPYNAVICDISPDKMHILIGKDDYSRLSTYNINNHEVIDGYGYFATHSHLGRNEKFLSNTIILSRGESDTNYHKYYIAQIDNPKIKYDIEFRVNSKRIKDITFSRDLKIAVAAHSEKGIAVILDTTPFRDWLYFKGLLFQPVKGEINADYLRIRENPNLEAPILGMLDTGTKVDVMDRSGVKMQIGDNEDYWYKVKTADGLTGWAYGAFVTLSDEIIPLVPPPVKNSWLK